MNLKAEAGIGANDRVIRAKRVWVGPLVEPDDADAVVPFGIGNRAKGDDKAAVHLVNPVGDVLPHQLALSRSHIGRKCRPRRIGLVEKIIHLHLDSATFSLMPTPAM